MQNQLSCAGVGYNLPDGKPLFTSLNFTLGPLKTGIVGRNGTGKTTLLDLLSGRVSPARGRIIRDGVVSYVRQHDLLHSGATVAQAIGVAAIISAHYRISAGNGVPEDYELLNDRWDLPEVLAALMAEVGVGHISLDRTIASLSGGELMRARVAGALVDKPDFLFLDEPTNHLDLSGRRFVYELVESWNRGLLVVSHDRALLARVDQMAELGPMGLKLYGGNWEVYCELRRTERSAAEQDLASARASLVRTKAAAQEARERQDRRSSAGKKNIVKRGISPMQAGNLKRRAQATASKLAGRHAEKLLEATYRFDEAKKLARTEDNIAVGLKLAPVPPARRLIELADVNYKYPDSAGLLWKKSLTFTVFGRERIWLKGSNGSGKSTLLDLILGTKQPSCGEVKKGTARVAILDQAVRVLRPQLSVLENVRWAASSRPDIELRNLLGRFMFRGDLALHKAATLSGGE